MRSTITSGSQKLSSGLRRIFTATSEAPSAPSHTAWRSGVNPLHR